MVRRRSRSATAMVMAAWMAVGACSPAAPSAEDPTAQPRSAVPPAISTPTSTTSTTVAVSARVNDLINAATLTEQGRRLFLAARPEVEDVETFAANCGADDPSVDSGGVRVHTQGCYVKGRIHLLAGDRAEARDLLVVVAAHELLHAAYASLGPTERSRVDTEVIAARPGNDRLEERLRVYGGGPTLASEIHSILGSEFDSVSPTLETHYAQFFANRRAVVAVRQRTLGTREDEIKRRKADVSELDARIAALKAAQDAQRAAGDIRGYNTNVPLVNAMVVRYNAQVAELNALIEEYNSILGS